MVSIKNTEFSNLLPGGFYLIFDELVVLIKIYLHGGFESLQGVVCKITKKVPFYTDELMSI